MKKVRIALAAMICAVLLSSVLLNTFAEPIQAEIWQADIRKLMDPVDIPHITEIRYRNTKDEADTVETHDIACQITSGNQSCGCEFTFEMNGIEIEDWTEIQNWLGDIVTHAAATAGADSEALAQAIDKAIVSAIRNVKAKADGTLPAWAQAGLNVSLIRVSMPFYPELSIGKNGEATKRLQQRLIELGFLNGKADGYFGAQTETAVKELEGYIRELETDAIEAHLAETPVPTATPTPTPTATPTPTPTPVPTPEPTHELKLVLKDGVTETPAVLVTPTPELTAVPTSTPMQVAEDLPIPEPMTPVDGVADALLQAYLYSESFNSARRALNAEDKGSDVTRLQVRLKTLGCSVDEPDGVFGGGTARAVRVFQYVNGLHQTGEADIATLKKLFSSDAKAPAHPMLALGSKGDDVKTLQTRLRELGFTTAGSDGDFGGNTQTAVERLQKYMRDREKAALEAAQGKDADVTDQLTIEVNGVADPILLDDLYSASFPVVPGTLKTGSAGGDVTRLQRRLSGLEYFYGGIDGSYGAATVEAVKDFQRRHKLTQDGIAGTETLKVLFSGNALKAMKPYLLKVSIADQRVYAYGLDDNSEYTVLVRTMKCSTGKDGTDTPRGTYQATTGPGARWHYFVKFKCWAQYAYYIQGDIMFHSVLYNEKNGPVTQSSVNNLGRKASHGCVRLSVEDAKWIYTNCPMRTKVIVY